MHTYHVWKIQIFPGDFRFNVTKRDDVLLHVHRFIQFPVFFIDLQLKSCDATIIIVYSTKRGASATAGYAHISHRLCKICAYCARADYIINKYSARTVKKNMCIMCTACSYYVHMVQNMRILCTPYSTQMVCVCEFYTDSVQ